MAEGEEVGKKKKREKKTEREKKAVCQVYLCAYFGLLLTEITLTHNRTHLGFFQNPETLDFANKLTDAWVATCIELCLWVVSGSTPCCSMLELSTSNGSI